MQKRKHSVFFLPLQSIISPIQVGDEGGRRGKRKKKSREERVVLLNSGKGGTSRFLNIQTFVNSTGNFQTWLSVREKETVIFLVVLVWHLSWHLRKELRMGDSQSGWKLLSLFTNASLLFSPPRERGGRLGNANATADFPKEKEGEGEKNKLVLFFPAHSLPLLGTCYTSQ